MYAEPLILEFFKLPFGCAVPRSSCLEINESHVFPLPFFPVLGELCMSSGSAALLHLQPLFLHSNYGIFLYMKL